MRHTQGLQFFAWLDLFISYLRMGSIYCSCVLMFTNLLGEYIRRYNSFAFVPHLLPQK